MSLSFDARCVEKFTRQSISPNDPTQPGETVAQLNFRIELAMDGGFATTPYGSSQFTIVTTVENAEPYAVGTVYPFTTPGPP